MADESDDESSTPTTRQTPSVSTSHRLPTKLRPTKYGGLLVALASVAVSLVSYEPLGERTQIRWTVGTHYHVGPDSVSTLGVVVAFPLALAAAYVGGRLLGRWFEGVADFDGSRLLYEGVVFGLLVLLLLTQVALVVANVYL